MAIANSDGSIILSTKVDTSGINKGMSQMHGKATSLTKTFSKLGAAIASAFAIQKIIQFSNEAGQLATQTEASVQRLIDIYGSASDSVGDFIDANARALGMSKSAAASFSSVYGNLFSVWADQATNAELTNRYLNMTAVVASKTGRTVEDVQERIRSGLLGNTEAIEDLGIFVNVKTIEMTDAFQRMAGGKSWEKLDAYTQQQIRSMAILEQATAKYGNEVADTSATTRSRFKAAYQDFQNSWGNIVNKVLVPVLETLTKIFDISTQILNMIAGKSGDVLENFEQQTEATEKTEENIEKEVENQKELNKEIKKSLAGFDDLQILTSNVSENLDQDIGTKSEVDTSIPSIPSIDYGGLPQDPPEFLTKIEEVLKRIKDVSKKISDIFMSGFWDGFASADFSALKQNLSEIGSKLNSIFTSPKVSASIKRFIKSTTNAFGKIVGSIAAIGTTIATNLFGGFNQYLQTNAPFIQTSIETVFDASAGIINSASNMWSAFSNILSVLISDEGTLLTASIIEIFANAGLEIISTATQIGNTFMYYLELPITQNQETIKSTLSSLMYVFTDFLTELKNNVSSTWSFVEQGLLISVHNIGLLWSGMWIDITNSMEQWSPKILEGMGSLFNDIWVTVIDPFIKLFVGAWSDFTGTLLSLWLEYGEPLVNNIYEFVNNIIGLFQSLYDNVLEPIIKPFLKTMQDLWDNHISGMIEKAGEFIMKLVNGALEIYNKFIHPIVSWITETLEPVFAWIGNTISGLFGTIVSFVSDTLGGVFEALGGLIDFIVGIFTGDWEKAWNGIKSFFVGIWDAIWGVIKGVINAIIDGLNFLWGALYGALAAIINGVGGIVEGIGNLIGADWGWEIPSNPPLIPKLAQGTVVPPNREFFAVLGDNKKEHEIVSPISTMKEAFREAMTEMGGYGQKEEHYYLSETEVMRVIYKMAKGGERLNGNSLISGGAY